jgi:hypothetical protein
MHRFKSMLAVTIGFVLAFPLIALGQGNTPLPCPQEWEPPDTSVLWDSGSVRLEADAIEMRRGDCFFAGIGPAEIHSDPGDPTYRTLEIVWEERGTDAGLNIYFAADETHWWVTEIRTPAGEFYDHESLPYSLNEVFRTPRGATFEGDVHLEYGFGLPELVIEGLRLTAFAPGTGPGPLTDCEFAATSKKALRRDPLGKGQPLRGSGIRKMSPEQAEALLRELGLCFTFRYEYPVIDTGGGYSERWCTAPPAGKVGGLLYLPDGEVVVFVDDTEPRPERAQPPEGWNCPAG